MARAFYHFTFRIPSDDLHCQGTLWGKRLRFLENLAREWAVFIDTDWEAVPFDKWPSIGFQAVSDSRWDYRLLRDWVRQLGFELVSECADAPDDSDDDPYQARDTKPLRQVAEEQGIELT